MKNIFKVLMMLVLALALIGCGEVEGHTHAFGEWVTVKEATEAEEGLKERTCECGEKETETIAKLEHVHNFGDCKCACGEGKVEEEVKIIVPQGNPFIAVGNLIGEENITIESVNGAAGVKAGLVGNDYDIVIAPLNLGAQLYVGGKSKYVLDSILIIPANIN